MSERATFIVGEREVVEEEDDIPDMEEEGLEDEDDAAVAAPKVATPTSGIIDGRCVVTLAHGLSADLCYSRVVKSKSQRETSCKSVPMTSSSLMTSITRHQDCGSSATTRFVQALPANRYVVDRAL